MFLFTKIKKKKNNFKFKFYLQEEYISFIPPNFDLLQEIRSQGEIVINNRNPNNQYSNGSNGNGSNSAVAIPAAAAARRAIVRPAQAPNNGTPPWAESSSPENASASPPISSSVATNVNSSSYVVSNKTYASIVKPQTSVVTGQCIPGSQNHVSVKPALAPSKYK